MRVRPLSSSCASRRSAVAAVELAILLPLLLLLFVLAVDFGRIFYFSLTVTNCARNGAVYASQNPTCAVDTTGIKTAAQKDGSNLTLSKLNVSSSTDNNTNPTYVDVTVSYPFTTITSYPGISNIVLVRTVRMKRFTPFVQLTLVDNDPQEDLPMLQRRPLSRSAATTVEVAIIASIVILLLFGLIIGGVGVYRYQEMAHLAREAARYASTHGGDYVAEGQPEATGVPAVSSDAQLLSYVRSKTVALDHSKLSVKVSWSAPSSVTPKNTPSYVDTDPSLVPPGQKVIRNYVTVTVSYQWQPEVFFLSPITLSSTSTMPMSY